METLNLDSNVVNKKPSGIQGTPPDSTSNLASKVPQKNPRKTPPNNIFKRIVHVPQAVAEWFSSLTPSRKILATVIICASILGIGGLAAYAIILSEPGEGELSIPKRITATVQKYSPLSDITLPQPSAPRDTENPINGELYTKAEFDEISSRYPIAVMIENHTEARPQYGFNSADLVFEALVEGGITRTMAIFWGKNAEEIGPVRSARQCYLEWLMPFDALYMHIGYASSDDPKVDAGGNIYRYKIKSLDRGGTFWRSSQRYAPHNAFTSTDLLYEKAGTYGYSGSPDTIEGWSFKRDASLEQRGAQTTATLVFFERLRNGGVYDVTWKYDRDSNSYLRFNNTTPYMDAGTDSQVYAKNVIIQRVETISTYDDKAHMIVTTIGNGTAIILRDGAVINGTWQKDSLTKRTRYFDTSGDEIVFNRGITWIEAVPVDQGTVSIES